MSDLFRCDWCGTMKPLDCARIWWTPGGVLADDQIWLPAVYCSVYCGDRASSGIGSGRG